MLNVDPSKCKRESTWGIKVYVERYKDICESSGGKVIDHLSNFYVTRIVKRIGPVAYRLDLSEELSRVHNVFHISMLNKYILDPSHVLETSEIELKDNLSYEEQPVQILGREEKELCNKTISLVKVLWRNHLVEEATWEREDQMRSQYPHLFHDTGTNFVDEISL